MQKRKEFYHLTRNSSVGVLNWNPKILHPNWLTTLTLQNENFKLATYGTRSWDAWLKSLSHKSHTILSYDPYELWKNFIPIFKI